MADLPDVVAAGYHVRPRPADELFIDIPKLGALMGKPVSGTENVRRIVRAQIERGVNVIKVMATERAGLPDTDPRKRVFTDEESPRLLTRRVNRAYTSPPMRTVTRELTRRLKPESALSSTALI